MTKLEAPLNVLDTYLPKGAFCYLEKYLVKHKVHLTITRERTSVLGNYQGGYSGKNHRISVNGTLNKFAFLITLLHELGHMMAFEKYGAKIPAHGKEWKNEYRKLLSAFITHRIFPKDIETELLSSLENPAASSCAETSLLRVLRKYDPHKPGFYLLEELPDERFFKISSGKVFFKLNKKRTRILAREVGTNKLYLFSPVTEVQLIRRAVLK